VTIGSPIAIFQFKGSRVAFFDFNASDKFDLQAWHDKICGGNVGVPDAEAAGTSRANQPGCPAVIRELGLGDLL
jgi:hypothetical protein